MLLLGILIGLFILVLLVVVHELGHALVAKRNGVVVEEFGIGFPPRAWSKRLKESVLGKNVLLSLNWLPLGGFVKLQGEHDAADKKGDYGAASYWVKTKILLAGVVMNWLVAIGLLTVISLMGMPKIFDNQFHIPGDTTTIRQPLVVGFVESGSPAEQAGLQVGDKLLRVDSRQVESSAALSALTKAEAGEDIDIIYARDGKEATTTASLNETNQDNRGYLGLSSLERVELRSTWSAPLVGIGTTVQFTWETLAGTGKVAWQALTGFAQSLSFDASVREAGNEDLSTVSNSVAGPIGILGIIFPQASEAGVKQLLFLSAIISLSLAVINTLPIPALDGGRWFTMTVYKLLKRPLTKEREEKIQTVGFMVLMGLVVLVTWADIGKLGG